MSAMKNPFRCGSKVTVFGLYWLIAPCASCVN